MAAETSARRERLIGFFGWCGTIGVLLAYALVSFSVLEPTNIWFQLLNLMGAAALCLLSLHKCTYQFFIVNLVWGLVALVAIVKTFF